MKTKLFIFLSFLFFTIITSCNIYNPAEPVPAYIHIENMKVKGIDTSSTGQGSNSSKITDAWIYIDDQLIGCFEMPCTVPVIADAGNHLLKIRPGIKVNGIAATRTPYPFYDSYSKSVNLQSGEITTITSATVTYNGYMTGVSHFPLIEDFESAAGITIDSTQDSETPLTKITSPTANVFEGTASAVGYVRSSNLTFECATVQYYQLNQGTQPVFLEFNYKCNHAFTVSVRGSNISGTTVINTARVEALTFNPTESWNKAYLYLSPAIGQLASMVSANKFKIYFGMRNYQAEDSLGLALDNIKIVQ